MANNTNWLNISSQSGSSGQTILTLSANKNLSTNYKTAEITAYNPVYNISAKTYVTLESYAPFLSISPGLFGVPDSGGTYELTIDANCAWVIAFPDLVTSFSTSAGTGNAVVTFTVPGTTADTTLVGNIVVTDESGQVSKIAKIEQYGSGVHIGVFPVELYFDSTGGSQTFSVSADAAYNVSVASGTDWAFVEPNSGYTGQTVFTVRVNSGYTGTTDRQGVINIDAPGKDLAVILYQRKPETRLVTVYDVTSTTDPTTILGDTSFFSKAELANGTEIALGTGYTFPSTGNQTVYYTLTGNTVGGFENSTALTRIAIPEGVTEIADSAFASCTNLTYIKIPDTVTQVGNSAFSQCSSLSSITLPDSLERMESAVFSGCTSLSSITIPSAVTNIGSNCFSGSSVSSITFTSLTPPTLGDANALTSNTLSEIIVPCPAVNDYITAYSQYAQYISCSDTGTTLYFTTDTSNVKGLGETRTITILNTNINPNRTGLNLPSDFPQQGSYVVEGNVIYLTYPANPSSSATRNWTIGVVAMTKDGVSLSGSYTITQNANVTYDIPYTADTSIVNKTGETRTITIDTSNLVASSITIGIGGATGVSYTYENGVITLIFPPNTNPERIATVTVNAETLNGNDATLSVKFVQDGEFIIPTGDSRVVVVYNVTSTTNPTKILNYPSSYNTTYPFTKAECPDGNEISLYTIRKNNGEYIFKKTGSVIVYYTLRNPSVLDWLGISNGGVFKNCNQITDVLIPDSVATIGDFTCRSCESLTSVTFSSALTRINNFAFMGCSNLNSISLPNGLVNIGQAAFSHCGLSSLTIPDSVTEIGPGCFGDCSSLSNIVIGNGITSLGTSIFESCTALTTVSILEEVTEIGDNCFANCTSLSNINFLPNSVGYIGNNAFKGCTSLSSVTIPTSTVILGNSCFEGCFALANIIMNGNLECLGSGLYPTDGKTFSGCTSLKTVGNFPVTLSAISYNTFTDCPNIESLRFLGTVPPSLTSTTTSLGQTGYTFPIYVPCESLSQYEEAFGEYYSTRLECIPTIIPISYTGNTTTVAASGENRYFTIELSNLVESSVTVTSSGDTSAIQLSYKDGLITVQFLENNSLDTNNVTIQVAATSLSGYPAEALITLTQAKKPLNEIPLTFELIDKAIIKWSGNTNVQYSINGGSWNTLSTDIYIRAAAGTRVSFRRFNDDIVTTPGGNFGGSTLQKFNVYGNIMSLLGKTDFHLLNTVGSSAFSGIFSGTGVVSAENLMLPATTLADNCYEYMFNGCRSLTTAPELPATKMAKGCYKGMFSGCNLATTPSLPATTLADSCYYGMFDGCTSLTQAPELPATTLAEYCYERMFQGCTSLTQAPELPATTLANYCYEDMFWGCKSLTSAPSLPATTLARYCYYQMFKGCTSLTTAPSVLPATALANSCYYGMFQGCTSLTTAPELPGIKLVTDCYDGMFSGCTNLNYIKCLVTDISTYGCTYNWVAGVASTGTFVTPSSTNWATGNSGIPTGWTRVNSDT